MKPKLSAREIAEIYAARKAAQNPPVTIKLSPRDSATVRELIESDAEPNEALRKAAQRYRENRPVSPSDVPDGPRAGEGAETQPEGTGAPVWGRGMADVAELQAELNDMKWLYHPEKCPCPKCRWFDKQIVPTDLKL